LWRDLGAVWSTTWMVVRLNSLARLSFLFVEPLILLDRFWAALGFCRRSGRNSDAGSGELSRCALFAIGFDFERIFALKIAQATIVGREKTHGRPEG
jgi:hypothetical protein